MEKLSTRLPAETLAAVERYADENDETNAAAARELIQSALEDWRGPSVDERIQRVRAEYESQIEDLEREVERLNRERRQIIEQRDEHQSLVRYAEDEQRYRRAGVLTRFRWWLRGMDDESDD